LTTRQYTSWRRLEPFTVLETRVQPAGVGTAGAALTSTTATMTSPACTPAGLGITTVLPTLLAPVEAERNTTDPAPPPPLVTVQVKVSVAPTLAPPSSLTVMLTA
jgi:hypothetical protein